jgi:hypothetical protein
MSLILLIILLALVLGGLPAWNLHSYGYAPSGALGVLLTVLLVLILLGRI